MGEIFVTIIQCFIDIGTWIQREPMAPYIIAAIVLGLIFIIGFIASKIHNR